MAPSAGIAGREEDMVTTEEMRGSHGWGCDVHGKSSTNWQLAHCYAICTYFDFY